MNGSLLFSKNCNQTKEVKITNNQDIFQKSIDNNQISFIISNTISDSKFNKEIFRFLGKLFAKAILENITINTCLNKIFFKIILNEKIELDDLVFIDKTVNRK